MSLVKNLSLLLGRELTADEATRMAAFQKANEIDDSDPLIAVLAFMARSQLIVETLPELLQQKATDTIELHQRTLQKQSEIIAKGLILTVAQMMSAAQVDWRGRWMKYGIAFAAGSVATAIIVIVLSRIYH